MPEPPAAFKETGTASAFTASSTHTQTATARTGDNESSSRVMASSAGLVPRPGHTPPKLPSAYISSATHFTPIVLADETSKISPSRVLLNQVTEKELQASKKIKELKRHLLKSHATDSIQEETPFSKPRASPVSSSEAGTTLNPSNAQAQPITASSQASVTMQTLQATPPSHATPIAPAAPQSQATVTAAQPLKCSAVRPQPRVNDPQAPPTGPTHNQAPPTGLTHNQAPLQPTPTMLHTPTSLSPNGPPTTPMQIPGQSTFINSSPAYMSSFPSFVWQQDPVTGAVQLITMVANMTPSSFQQSNTPGTYATVPGIPAPYWSIPAQQTFIQQIPVNVSHEPDRPIESSAPNTTRRSDGQSARQRSSSSERVLEGARQSRNEELRQEKSHRSRSLGRGSPKLSVFSSADKNQKTENDMAAGATSSRHCGKKNVDNTVLTLGHSEMSHVPRGRHAEKTASKKNLTVDSKDDNGDDPDEDAPSSSASKDSGIVTHRGSKNTGDYALMERLLSQDNLNRNSLLGKIAKLIRQEFAYDGYMDNGVEDMAMSEFIAGLEGLKWDTFCSATVEKYCDLFWSEELLIKLYEAVNNKLPVITRPPSITGALRTGTARVLSIDEPDTSVVSNRKAPSPFRPIGIAISTNAVQSGLVKPKPLLAQIQETSDSMDGSSTDLSSAEILATAVSTPSLPSLSLSKIRSSSVQDLSSRNFEPLQGRSLSQSALNALSSNDTSPTLNSATRSGSVARSVIHIQGKNGETDMDDVYNRSMFEQESDSQSSTSDQRSREQRMGSDGRRKLHSSASGGSNPHSSHSSQIDPYTDSAFGSKMSSEYDMPISKPANLTDSKLSYSGVIFYATTLDSKMGSAISLLTEKSENKSVGGLQKKLADLEQQIAVHCKRRNKAVKYIGKIQNTPMPSSGANKAGAVDYKALLSQIRSEHQDAVKEMEYLNNTKNQIEVLLAEQWSLEHSQLYSFAKVSSPLIVVSTDENPYLQFQTVKDPRTRLEKQQLHSGRPTGLISFLFAKDALCDGYILEFFHSYRYFTKPSELFGFLADKYSSALLMADQSLKEKIVNRALALFRFWIEAYYSIDFKFNRTLEEGFISFVQEEISGHDPQEAELLLQLLDDYQQNRRSDLNFLDTSFLDYQTNGISEEDLIVNRKWNSSKSTLTVGSGKSAVQFYKGRTGLASCVTHKGHGSPGKQSYHSKVSRAADAFSLADYTAHEIAEQLTLSEQDLFDRCHPVHFMNSLAQGIGANMDSLSRSTNKDCELLAGASKCLFVGPYTQDSIVQQMISRAQRISYWVTAELISSPTTKVQSALLLKFIHVAKICKEIHNYATCVALTDGLEHILIRHMPAWKDVPSKLIQELDGVKLLLKSDSLILTSDDSSGLPTIPSILLFILHVQQLEQGGFTLANGMFRWPKLKALAKVVDQIRQLKRYRYDFTPNQELKNDLEERIQEFWSHDLHTLAIDSSAVKFASEKRWAGVFKKVKGKFTN